MSAYEHSRFKIVNSLQHPYRHSLSDFIFSHDALPSTVTNLEQAMTWVFDVIYPKVQPSVADVASLPSSGNTTGDQRIVEDDGDGKAAMYMWTLYDGDATEVWHKIMDVDWSTDGILAEMVDRTQPYFMIKHGNDDYDDTGTIVSGLLAGQSLYGGQSSNTHLSLFANNGDITSNTGYIQLGDDTRPLVDSMFSIGTDTERFLAGYFDELEVGTTSYSSGSLTDTSGAISFDDENLSTTGTLLSGAHTIGTLLLNSSSITDTSGTISFGDDNVTTTGNITGAAITASSLLIDNDISISSGSITSVSNAIGFGSSSLTTASSISSGNNNVLGSSLISTISLSDNLITSTNTVDHLEISAGGLKAINITSTLLTGNLNATGGVSVIGSFSCDNITMNGNDITAHGDIVMQPSSWIVFRQNTRPFTDNFYDIGLASIRFKTLYLANSISDGTNSILTSELMGLRSANYRDTGRTSVVQTGDCLFWSGTEWLASSPDTEIEHDEISGLTTTDAGHTQFVMLGGRTGGQSISGGDATTETMTLLSNTIDGEGVSILTTAISPIITDTYDLGTSTNKFDDLYMVGEGIGFRAENGTVATIASECGAGTAGRLFWSTDDNFMYVDIGGSPKKVGQNTYNEVLANTAIEGTQIDVTTGTDIIDARNCIWQLKEIGSSDEILHVVIQTSSTHLEVLTDYPLPTGNYRLLGIEV